MIQTIKRWSIYLVTFLCAFILAEQYQDYRQYKALEEVRKDLIRQEQEAEKNCIKNALYYEARSEGKVGIIAVASVIENRKNHPSYPASYCGVIQQHKQFSYTLEGKPDVEAVVMRLKASDKQAYMHASYVSEQMVSGSFKPTLPETVLHYTTTKIKNYWTKTKKIYATIGNHRFYKEKEPK